MALSMPDDEIRRRHKWGCPVDILADLNGCDQKAIREVLKEENDMSKFDWEKARELYDEGASDQKIGQQLGCSAVTVFQWRRKNDLPTKHQSWGGKVKAKKPEMIPSEAIMAGEVIQSVAESTNTPGGSRPARPTTCTIPVITEPAADDWQQEIDDLRDDVDDLIHEMYLVGLKAKRVSEQATEPAVRPLTFSDMVHYPGIYEQDDIDDLLHGWYLTRTIMQWNLSTQAEEMQDDIDDLLAEMYAIESAMKYQARFDSEYRLDVAERISRLQLENQLLFAMLLGAGVRDVRDKLKEVMG